MNSNQDQITFHQRQAFIGTVLMVGFFAIAIALVAWRIWSESQLKASFVGLSDTADLTQEVQTIESGINDLKGESKALRAGVSSSARRIRSMEWRSLRAFVGLSALNCSGSEYASRFYIPVTETNRANELLKGADDALLEEVCTTSKELPIFAELRAELAKHKQDPQYCPPDVTSLLERATAATLPSEFPNFESEFADAPSGVCGLNWEDVSEYLEAVSPATAQQLRKRIRAGIQNTTTRLEEIPGEQAALEATRIEKLEALAAAQNASDGWQAKLAKDSTLLWLNTLLVIVAMVGVNAGYRMNRSHNFEIVRVRRQALGLEAIEKLMNLNVPATLDLATLLMSPRDINPFNPTRTERSLDGLPTATAKELVRSITSATKTLGDALKAIKS